MDFIYENAFGSVVCKIAINLSRSHTQLNPAKSTCFNQFLPAEACAEICHDGVVKWKHFLRNWPFSQRQVTRSFDVFFDLRPNKRLSKHSRRRWFDTPSRSLWRHCNVLFYPLVAIRWFNMTYEVENCHQKPWFHECLISVIPNNMALVLLFRIISDRLCR